jgi:oligoendopeptidase F
MSKVQTEWNFDLFFGGKATEEKLKRDQASVVRATRAFVKKWKGKDNYLKDPKVLRKALDEYEAWRRKWGVGGRSEYYYWLRAQKNLADPKNKAALNKIEDFAHKNWNEIEFFTHRIARIPATWQRQLLRSRELLPYRHFLERLFDEGKYLLSEAEERILTLKSGPSYSSWTRMRSDLVSRETRKVKDEQGRVRARSVAELLALLSSTKKSVRAPAARGLNEIYARHADIAEAELNAVLQNKKIEDELRGFARPEHARHLADDIDTEVVDVMAAAVKERFDISRRFYRLRARLLGVKRLRYWERLVEHEALNQRYGFGQAVSVIARALGRLDPEFSEILARFVRDGQVDAYPARGKKSGAFCAGDDTSLPTFIMLNYTRKLEDVRVFAHELGHGINNELLKQKQNALNIGTPTSTAEVASTFMEDFVLQELAQDADRETRLAIAVMRLDDAVGTIFRQVAAYRFEQKLHTRFREKGYLAKDEIGGLFTGHMASYLGSAVEISKGVENWWVDWAHFRYYFYVYSYASGLLISKALQRMVRGDPRTIGKVKEFLAAGTSASPRAIFKKLGIDITKADFWEDGLRELADELRRAERLARQLGKV